MGSSKHPIAAIGAPAGHALTPSRTGAQLPLWLVAIVVGLHAARVALVWDELPPVLASHFGISGRADGWMSKPAFFAFDAAVIALMATIPFWIRVLPAQFINVPLPHRDYWFAPERRRESLARMAPWFNWLALIATLFMVIVLDQVVRANLPDSNAPILTMTGLGIPVLTFLIAMIIWMIAFQRSFRDLPSSPQA